MLIYDVYFKTGKVWHTVAWSSLARMTVGMDLIIHCRNTNSDGHILFPVEHKWWMFIPEYKCSYVPVSVD